MAWSAPVVTLRLASLLAVTAPSMSFDVVTTPSARSACRTCMEKISRREAVTGTCPRLYRISGSSYSNRIDFKTKLSFYNTHMPNPLRGQHRQPKEVSRSTSAVMRPTRPCSMCCVRSELTSAPPRAAC
eukprot:2880150-Prymnesium_polylepis.1